MTTRNTLQEFALENATTHGLVMSGISKRFGGHQALDGVSISLDPGQVLALCGANGAGKSTLVKILAGVEHADHGHIRIGDETVHIDSPTAASRLGLSFVHQELNLVPKFTGLQNMALGSDEGRQKGVLNHRKLRRRTQEVGELLGYQVELDKPVNQLSVSDRWMVSLGRSLMRPAKFVAMDEPTASFTDEEAERLFRVIENLTDSGVGILYISHRLEEVLDVSDKITVFRNGQLVGDFASADLNLQSLTQHIVGREVTQVVRRAKESDAKDDRVRLRVEGLQRLPAVRDATFDLHVGEILGIAGLVGSGRTELARLLIGADRVAGGKMTLLGSKYSPSSPHSALRSGVVLVPEERRSQGLVLTESVDSNLAMAALGKSRWLTKIFWPKESRAMAWHFVQRFGIKTTSIQAPINSLSGGNQQKVVVGKYVRTNPQILILDEPTVGVDIGARAEIYEIIKELAEEGTSVIVISSDFEELAICDRALVVRNGTIVADVPGEMATKDHLTTLCFGHIEEES